MNAWCNVFWILKRFRLSFMLLIWVFRKSKSWNPAFCRWCHQQCHQQSFTPKHYTKEAIIRNAILSKESSKDSSAFAIILTPFSDGKCFKSQMKNKNSVRKWYLKAVCADAIVEKQWSIINHSMINKLVGIDWSLLSSPSYTYTHGFSLIGAKF